MMRGKGHVGREWHRQRAQCIINAISKPGYLVCKVSSEGSAENAIFIISSCLVSVVAVQKFINILPTKLVVTASILDSLTIMSRSQRVD